MQPNCQITAYYILYFIDNYDYTVAVNHCLVHGKYSLHGAPECMAIYGFLGSKINEYNFNNSTTCIIYTHIPTSHSK